MAKRRIIDSRHRIPLKESMEFTQRKEVELRRAMERRLTAAFPDSMERKSYIMSLINELDREIEESK